MAKYSPIDIGVPLKARESNLAALEWSDSRVVADFFLPDDDVQVLRVSFEKQCIIRILDEMSLDTEDEDTPDEGLVPEHFAYRVEGAVFARIQSEAWKEMYGPVTHYRFITWWTCIDVLTAAIPSFTIVRRA